MGIPCICKDRSFRQDHKILKVKNLDTLSMENFLSQFFFIEYNMLIATIVQQWVFSGKRCDH